MDDPIGAEGNTDIGKFLFVFHGNDRNVSTDGLDYGIKLLSGFRDLGKKCHTGAFLCLFSLPENAYPTL